MSMEDKVMRVGVMGFSSFAERAMIPAISAAKGVELAAIASRSPEKAEAAADQFSCRSLVGYESMVDDPELDLIYMPLPTGIHEEWVRRVVDAGKHLLVEKSLAGDLAAAERMIDHAREAGLLLRENFLFRRHGQFNWVKRQLAEGAIGDLRVLRAAFTIPALDDDNFRYSASLGGGSLLDVGAYMVQSTLAFLGPDIELLSATSEHSESRGVDLRGSAMFRNSDGVISQVFWGFDTHYQCTWDLQGTDGRIVCDRALTSPPGFDPPVRLERGMDKEVIALPADNHYVNQWEDVAASAGDPQAIVDSHDECLEQARWLFRVLEATRP